METTMVTAAVIKNVAKRFFRHLSKYACAAVCISGCASVKNAPKEPPKTMEVRTTAYTHTEPGGSYSAMGTRLRFGGSLSSAASDWSWMPVGTRFRLCDKGVWRSYVIEDYGSALVGKKTIDLYMPTDSMMRAWGVRTVSIEIEEWGSVAMSRMLLSKRRDSGLVRAMLASMPESDGAPTR
jgi:3D (Asp-Asp-Asp) domain-containing protein